MPFCGYIKFEKGNCKMQTIKRVSASTVDAFIKENRGEIIGFELGTLLDNMVISFNFGTLFCFEQYVNEWCSAYTLYFFHADRERGIKKMWEKFDALKETMPA